MKGFTFAVIALALLCGCRTEQVSITEPWMEREILSWWGAKEIDAVVIEDYRQEDSAVTVLARLVVGSDTTARMSYEFRRFRKAWRILKGPVDDEIREYCIQQLTASPIQKAREVVLKANGANLRTGLEMYYATTGSYPSHITGAGSSLNDELEGYLMPGIKNSGTGDGVRPPGPVFSVCGVRPLIPSFRGYVAGWGQTPRTCLQRMRGQTPRTCLQRMRGQTPDAVAGWGQTPDTVCFRRA